MPVRIQYEAGLSVGRSKSIMKFSSPSLSEFWNRGQVYVPSSSSSSSSSSSPLNNKKDCNYYLRTAVRVILTSMEPTILRMLFSIKNQKIYDVFSKPPEPLVGQKNPFSTRNIDMAGYVLKTSFHAFSVSNQP